MSCPGPSEPPSEIFFSQTAGHPLFPEAVYLPANCERKGEIKAVPTALLRANELLCCIAFKDRRLRSCLSFCQFLVTPCFFPFSKGQTSISKSNIEVFEGNREQILERFGFLQVLLCPSKSLP